MATIVHSCSSILVRPNGIVRYINSVIDLQKKQGHTVYFVTDSKPTEVIDTKIIYQNNVTKYVPNMKDGHVWLQIDNTVSSDLRLAFNKIPEKIDLIICHDLHSYLALKDQTGIFVQHESDVQNPTERYSFLSDEYLNLQLEEVASTDWKIGSVVKGNPFNCKHTVFTPAPFTVTNINSDSQEGLLYIGDSTDRKGASEFMEVARQLNITPTVITHDKSDIFAGANVYSFGLEQKAEMFELIARHKVAFIPSRNECLSLAVLECLQFMPVVLNNSYAWTKYQTIIGATVVPKNEIINTIKQYLNLELEYSKELILKWSEDSINAWDNVIP
jgi:hypothetical protein